MRRPPFRAVGLAAAACGGLVALTRRRRRPIATMAPPPDPPDDQLADDYMDSLATGEGMPEPPAEWL